MITNRDVASILATAAAEDIKNPTVLFLVSDRTEKGKKAVQDLVASDILAGLRGSPDPPIFPNVRDAVQDLIRAAKIAKSQPGVRAASLSGMNGNGLGQVTTIGAKTMQTGATAASGQPSDVAQIVGSILGAAATIGAAYYVGRTELKAQKETYKQEQRTLAAQASAQAAELEALQRMKGAGVAEPGLPSWLLPVGLGVAAIAAIFYFGR